MNISVQITYFLSVNLVSENFIQLHQLYLIAQMIGTVINMDRKLFNLVVKKAFDTVDHEILLQKLKLVGITGRAFLLLKSYLTGHTQRCEINGSITSSISGENDVKCGVLQGSILGPLYSSLHHLHACLSKTESRLFADDTNITAAGECLSDLEDAVNSDLEMLRKWLMAIFDSAYLINFV